MFEAPKLPLCRCFMAMQSISLLRSGVANLELRRHLLTPDHTSWPTKRKTNVARRLAGKPHQLNGRVEIDDA